MKYRRNPKITFLLKNVIDFIILFLTINYVYELRNLLELNRGIFEAERALNNLPAD